MIYAYDIVLNFNEKFYNFFEWNENDSIDYIKKIPVFKVSNSMINDIINNNILINVDFIKKICNKTKIYMNTGLGTIEYTCLFCSNDLVIAVEFNENGKLLYKSDLIIDEALDVIKSVKSINSSEIKYKKGKKENIRINTRSEEKKISFVIRELNNIYENRNIDKIKYLYYECFNDLIEFPYKMLSDLKQYTYNNPNKLFNILSLNYTNK